MSAPHRAGIPNQTTAYTALHTHPGCSTFSPGDSSRFIKRNNMKMLTAIGHDGHIYAIEKTAAFDKDKFSTYVEAISKETDRIADTDMDIRQKLKKTDAFIRAELKEMSDCGVKYYE